MAPVRLRGAGRRSAVRRRRGATPLRLPIARHDGVARALAVAQVFGVRLTGFVAWWIRRTYYLFQMPRSDRRLRMVLDWTVALLFRPDITKVDLAVEQDQARRNCAAGVVPERERA